MKGPFNTDFYATAATVIPVFYLALAVQGSTFGAMLTWLSRIVPGARKGYIVLTLTEGRLVWMRRIPRFIWLGSWGIAACAFGTVVAVTLSLAANLLSEIFAIWALFYGRQSSAWQAQWVLWSLISLAFVIASVTFARAFQTFFQVLTHRRKLRRAIDSIAENVGSPEFEAELAAMEPTERAELLAMMERTSSVMGRIIEAQLRYNAAVDEATGSVKSRKNEE
jgi:hypothetical protein